MSKQNENKNECKDSVTGLIWCTKEFKPMKWEEAMTFAKTYKQGKYRLPTIQELVSLVDFTKHSPSINRNNFPSCHSSSYWSATPYATSSNYAWGVYFGDGGANGNYKDGSLYVHLVRNK